MTDWIPFGEGKYFAEKAFLLSPVDKAIELESAYIEIYTGAGGKRLMRGRSFVRNILIVLLLEDSDDLDILLDLGPEHRYRIFKPDINAGKVFSPDVKSRLQFVPTRPWQHLTEDDYRVLSDRMEIVAD